LVKTPGSPDWSFFPFFSAIKVFVNFLFKSGPDEGPSLSPTRIAAEKFQKPISSGPQFPCLQKIHR
jgi:hypothetical protein